MFPLFVLAVVGVALVASSTSSKSSGSLDTSAPSVFTEIPTMGPNGTNPRADVIRVYNTITDPTVLCNLASSLDLGNLRASANQLRLRARQLGGNC